MKDCGLSERNECEWSQILIESDVMWVSDDRANKYKTKDTNE